MTEHASRPALADESVGQLVAQLSAQVTRLMRDELQLAKLEMAGKGKRAGRGAGLFGGAGLLALLGVGSLVAAAIAGLALVVDTWLAALLVGIALLIVAGVGALLGKRSVAQATPPVPHEAVSGVKQDIERLKPSGST